MVLLISATPVSETTLTLVMLSPAMPLSTDCRRWSGYRGRVSTMTFFAVEAALVVPEPSVAVAVKPWLPSISAVVTRLQAPFAPATILPSRLAPS